MIRLLLSLVVLLPAVSFAQLSDRLTIEMQPRFPESNTPLALTVRSISTDLSRAAISWYVNGELVSEGFGVEQASAVTGALGTRTEIRVEVIGENEELLVATRTVLPAEVDLLWETDSYVPPLYQGKRLASSGTQVRAEALPRFLRPDGTRISTKDIIFTWRKNDAVIPSVSGRGKSSALFSAPELFGSDTITVEAASVDNSLLGAASVIVPSRNPFVLLYEEHPLFGTIFHRALGEESRLPDTEATFTAAPFFAGAATADDSRLSYAWRVNRTSITSDESTPSRITINADGSDGTARIELTVNHSADIVMNAQGIWRIVLNNGFPGGVNDLFGEQ